MKHTQLAFAVVIIMIAIHAKAQTQKPNIILILGDDIGYKVPTVNGGKSYSTPNIDSMARHGMRFTQCHASPMCSPSRFMLLTGKYNFRNYTRSGLMDTTQRTFANMFQSAGYKTACFGKWQLDGGDASIHAFGFDSYCVINPLGRADDDENLRRYKNPTIYTNGEYVPNELVLNKYSEDIFTDSVMNFIENNKAVPFFIYYPMVLAHKPFQPTPDDSDFATWKYGSDTAYFPSMIKYMDKKIGEIIKKVKKIGIENNTVIIYIGDNGTPYEISEYVDNDSLITGGKGLTTENGIRVPMIFYWPKTINAGLVNNDLIGFTDFLPTLADIANIPVPTNYGPLDGVSFAPRLVGNEGTPRAWLFYHYDSDTKKHILIRWAQTKKYKLYDTSTLSNKRLFYNIINDVNEEHPLSDNSLTAQEQIIRNRLLNVINHYVAQGTPLLSLTPPLSLITDSSVVLRCTIKSDGGSTVTASGAVWGTSPDPEISSSNYTQTGISCGPFLTQVTGLKANTLYYIRAYATNFAGTAYSNQIIFKTLLNPPVATKATEPDSNKFTANWKAYDGAINYRLDVSTSRTFKRKDTIELVEGFDNGITPPTGWIISNNIFADSAIFGIAPPSLEFRASNTQVLTKKLNGPATQLKFWIKGLNTDNLSSCLVEGFDGNKWTTIANLASLSKTGETKIFNANSSSPLAPGFIQFRFTYTKGTGTLAFDDVSIRYNNSVPFFIPGYNNLGVKTNSKIVTGLKPGTNYYYRVRAETDSTITGNSNVIAVTTNKAGLIHETTTSINNSSVITINNGLKIKVSPNPSSDEFVLTTQTSKNEKIEITVIDMQGREVYRATGSGNNKYIFGRTFAPGVYIARVIQGNYIQTIKVVKTE